MIDLEHAFAPLVEGAPEPPAVDGVRRRGQQRQRRRRGLATTTALVLVVAAVCGAAAIMSSRSTPHVASVPPTEHVRVTMLDGSQLEISGPQTLGLSTLTPAFNGALGPASGEPQWGTLGHGFSVGRTPPADLGAVVGRYRTHDGHELVVHTSQTGVTAVAQYGDWWLSATWATSPPAQWTSFASELNAKETADGFLVIQPTDTSWKLGPADAPDAQLGGDAYGSGAAFGFFGPGTYPAGCPTAAETSTHTPQGWAVSVSPTEGAAWCDPDAHLRIWTWDTKLADAAVQGLRVAYTPAILSADRITTLDGSSFEVTAPSSVLDQLILQASVSVEGVDSPNVLNVAPDAFPVTVTRASLPAGATSPSFETGDGHRFSSYVLPTKCACQVLAGTYGPWLVEIEVDAMSAANRARVASAFRAHETSDGFLVIDPTGPLHLGTGPGSPIVLDGVDVNPGATPEVFVHDSARPLAGVVRVRRIG